MGYLDNTGLTYFWGKIKAAFGATLTVSGKTVTLKSKSGATLSTITTQDTNTHRTFYCTCTTAAATAAKVVTCADSDFVMETATIIVVTFTNTNSASNVTLNVNSKGAKNVRVNNATYTGSSSSYNGYASRQIVYMYDGTGWAWIGKSWDSNTTYSAATTSANGLMSSGDKTKLDGVATGATKNSITTATATLTVAGWSNKSQTVSVSGVTTTNLILVSTDNVANGIKCTAQGSGTLTFTCESVPTSNVTVSVAKLS